jgi:subtilisin family serine protease
MKTAIPYNVGGICLLILGTALSAQQDSAIRDVPRTLPGQYIVVLRGPDDPLAVGLETASLMRGQLRRVYRHSIRGFAIELSEPAVRTLENDPRVAYIEQDQVVVAASSRQSGTTWGLDRIDQRALPLDAEFQRDSDGAGVHVYVVDSGIRVTHTEFDGRAFIAGDHVDDDGDGDLDDVGNDDDNPTLPDGIDCNGHGTHIESLIAPGRARFLV